MTDALLMALFGLTLIAAACNMPAWWRLTILAYRFNLDRKVKRARMAMTFTNAGLLVGCWYRLSGVVDTWGQPKPDVPLIVGVDLGLAPIIIPVSASAAIFWLALLLVGEVLMLLGSSDALREAGRPRPCLWAFLILAPLWTIFSIGVGR
ncbi:MAG: hypothetical protein V4696_10280 [Pseudomonadota bacterium]